jgi:hypothetical protein
MKVHEVLFSMALEAQRFDLDVPPAALPLIEFGLAQLQAARTPAELFAALQAIPGVPTAPKSEPTS